MIGIYKITNPLGKVYIGSSINIEKRFNQYRNLECSRQPKVFNSLKKYSAKNHKFSILEKCEMSELNKKERYWQERYNVLGNFGLNLVLVDTKTKRQVHSSETIEKIRQANLGKIVSEVSKEKMSVSKKGRKISKKQREEHSKRMTGKGNPMYGTTMSEEHKEILREANKNIIRPKGKDNPCYGIKHSKEHIDKCTQKKNKPVLDHATGILYASGKLAAKALGIKYNTLNSYLIGARVNKTSLEYI